METRNDYTCLKKYFVTALDHLILNGNTVFDVLNPDPSFLIRNREQTYDYAVYQLYPQELDVFLKMSGLSFEKFNWYDKTIMDIKTLRTSLYSR